MLLVVCCVFSVSCLIVERCCLLFPVFFCVLLVVVRVVFDACYLLFDERRLSCLLCVVYYALCDLRCLRCLHCLRFVVRC